MQSCAQTPPNNSSPTSTADQAPALPDLSRMHVWSTQHLCQTPPYTLPPTKAAHIMTSLCPAAGYGFRAPNDCWASAWMVVAQSIWGQLLDAIVLGVIFARISHPKQRARTVFMSDSAVIARRDGILKFMFRVGDIRQTQACCPILDCRAVFGHVQVAVHHACTWIWLVWGSRSWQVTGNLVSMGMRHHAAACQQPMWLHGRWCGGKPASQRWQQHPSTPSATIARSHDSFSVCSV